MATDELESFINQFKYLSSAGYCASLKLTTEMGAVKVSFDVSLGFLPPPLTRPPPQTSGKKRNSSYLRRQEKRRGLHSEFISTSANGKGSSQSYEKDASESEPVDTAAIETNTVEVKTCEVVHDKLDRI